MRQKAFTLTEMLVVLALSAIVITVAFAVFTQVFSLQIEQQKRSHDAGELLLFDQQMRRDARLATDVQMTKSGFRYLLADGKLLSEYSTNEAGMGRNSGEVNEVYNVHLLTASMDSTPRLKELTIRFGPDETSADTLIYHIKRPATAQTPSSANQ